MFERIEAGDLTIDILASIGPLGNNVYVVSAPDSPEALLVDASLQSAAAVQALLRERRLTLATIVPTHSHWDHVAEAGQLAAATGATVAAHELDAPALALPQRSTFLPLVQAPPTPVARPLADGDLVQVGPLALQVLDTPGHTPGSICLYAAASGVLLSGDTLFAGSYGRVDLPGGSPEQMRRSLRRLAALPPETAVFPGHGATTTIGAEPWLRRVPI